MSRHQPWIRSASVDSVWLLSPPFLATAAVLWFQPQWEVLETLPPTLWFVLIVLVDVAHVYATLYRTYLNRQAFEQDRTLYSVVPLLGWFCGMLLYSLGPMIFWRLLAYLAVFHFMRQQYGFVSLYSRNDSDRERRWRLLDQAAIYLATLYPLLYWHTHLPRPFDWFVEGDFVPLPPFLDRCGFTLYVSVLLLYTVKEVGLWARANPINVPKNLVVFGTVLSWYVGIVLMEADLAFTAINVVSHGIPYLAFVWIYGRKQFHEGRRSHKFGLSSLFSVWGVPLFFLSLVGFAYLEEGLWDGLVWRDHPVFFVWSDFLPHPLGEATLAWLVPLLALPQITHYILDGFIWRLRKPRAGWTEMLAVAKGKG